MSLCTGETILRLLREHLPQPDYREFVALYAKSLSGGKLFVVLVATILSQNTSDRNAIRAFRKLVEALGSITPRSILEASTETLAEAVKPAGLWRRRVETLREVAKFFLENPWVEERICEMPLEEARKLLMSIRGVGPKTVDVTLMNVCGAPVFPVDTHISRILERWGVHGDYETKRRWGESFFPRDSLRDAHLLLIQLGRLYCKPSKPRCSECPVRVCCPYAKTMGSQR